MALLPDIRLTGATVLRDGEMQRRSVAISRGLFARGPFDEVDCTGYLILPGIIDLHGDAFERHLAPRRSAPFPAEMGLASTDRDAAANGVTTAYLAQSWSWEGGHRGPDHAEILMAALDAYRPHLLTDLRLQIRCETHTPETRERLLAAVRRHRIGYVVFNDHLQEAQEMEAADDPRLARWAADNGRSVAEHMAVIQAARARADEVPAYLNALAEAFDAMGVVYGSHDDRDAAMRQRHAALGARIAEFPTSLEAATAAHGVGDPVLMGAPNVVRGGSQSGNVPAERLIRRGVCDALVSDYHYPALAAAAFRLADQGLRGLPEAWAMISTNPARILRMTDRGRIAPGLRADMILVHAGTRRIEATISGGRIAWLSGEAARRFLSAGLAERALAG